MTAFAVLLLVGFAAGYNGPPLKCPDDCECDYYGATVLWVTDCSESNLTQIPYDELDPKVYYLDANWNDIADVAPFPPDFKLGRLQLANNLLTEVRKESFTELRYVIDVTFAGNRIRRIDPYTFTNMTAFLTLELQDNPLDCIAGPFLYSDHLYNLTISNCNLSYLNVNFFDHLTSLSVLDVSSNPLNVLVGPAFHPLRRLSTLKLNNCNLSFIDTDVFKHDALATLELAGNRFKNVQWSGVFKPLVRLRHLDFRKSGLTGADLPSSTFPESNSIETLILSENDLGKDFDVSGTIGEKLFSLYTLHLSRCNIWEPLSEDAFTNLTVLKDLDLSGNELVASDLLLALAPLKYLETLTLSHSGLSKLPDILHQLNSLTELDISHNPLNDVFVKLVAPLGTLKYLNMGYSNLSNLAPDTFSKMTSMERLVLSGNDLNSLEAGLFANLTSLKSLELNSCGLLRPINATAFFKNLTYTYLTELHLAGNPLHVSPNGALLPKQLSDLEQLDLSNCNLTFLPNEAFQYTTQLIQLNLTGNLFSTASNLLFLTSLPELNTLDLRYNQLTSITPRDIEANTKLEKLKLIGNPWRCDCWVSVLWESVLEKKGNLHMFEGAVLESGDMMTQGRAKRLLVCHVDQKTHRKKGTLLRKMEATNRTWGKYVRESGCEAVTLKNQPKHRSKREVAAEVTVEEKLQSQANHAPNTWGHNLAYVTIFYAFALCIVYLLYVVLKRRNKPVNRKIH